MRQNIKTKIIFKYLNFSYSSFGKVSFLLSSITFRFKETNIILTLQYSWFCLFTYIFVNIHALFQKQFRTLYIYTKRKIIKKLNWEKKQEQRENKEK